MSHIATAPTATDGIVYAISLAEPHGPSEREFVKIEILVAGEVWRSTMIDVSALDGVVRGLQRAAEVREQAQAEATELLHRLGNAP